MSECNNHVESIHSNFVISRNHWPALTVWATKLIAAFHKFGRYFVTTFRHKMSSPELGQLARVRISSTHTTPPAAVCVESDIWICHYVRVTVPRTNRTLHIRTDYQDDPTVKLLSSLRTRKHAMVVSHNINLTVTLIACVTLLLNLVIQIWKINLKYPGSSQPTRRHSNCETTTNRQTLLLNLVIQIQVQIEKKGQK